MECRLPDQGHAEMFAGCSLPREAVQECVCRMQSARLRLSRENCSTPTAKVGIVLECSSNGAP